ncbi:MAG: CHAD domain-containing protein [Phycisphaerae bacterium]
MSGIPATNEAAIRIAPSELAPTPKHPPPLGAHIARLLRRSAKAIEECEAGTRAGDDAEALHDMRVASRRLRAALRLFAEILPHRRAAKLSRRLRRLTRALGMPREWDVLRETLTHLRGRQRGDVEKIAVEHALEYIDAHRSISRKRMLRALDKIDLGRLTRGIRKLAAKVDAHAVDEPEKHLAWRALEPLIAAALAEIDILRSSEDAKRLHETRISVKRLRYAVELLEPAMPIGHGDLLARLKNLQELLGHHHDCAVLHELLLRMLGGLEERGRTILADGLREAIAHVREDQATTYEQFCLATSGMSVASLSAEIRATLRD